MIGDLIYSLIDLVLDAPTQASVGLLTIGVGLALVYFGR